MKYKYLLMLITGLVVFSCTHKEAGTHKQASVQDPRFPECYECSGVENLYYFADTTFTRHDSLFIVNKRLDTTVVETGIFTYLQHSYPVYTPSYLVSLIKQGVQAETNDKPDRAISLYQEAITFYQNDWLKRKTGFENGGFSDLNDYYAANVNVTILVSYAFEKRGQLPEARSALSRFLANVEAENSRIKTRYIQLCIQQYGKAATRKALETCGTTVHQVPNEDSPESHTWRVAVFGADIGVADFNTDSLSAAAAQRIIWEQPFYALVK